jgi:branched-chain amino acid transport system substrate-binding protein
MKKLLLATLIFCLAAGTAYAADTIKIGLMAPLTGSWASEGQEMKQVLDLLAAQLNEKGGVLGNKVEVISEDDGGDPKTAALAAQKLTTQGVVAVIGTYGSSVTEASQTIYNESKIIQVANGSTNVRLTDKGFKYFFRTCGRDDAQGAVAAQTIVKMGIKKVAILHDNTTYAKGLAEVAKGLLEPKGITIVFYDALTPNEQDYTTVLTKVKNTAPELVFFTGYYKEAGLLLRQAKEMNWKVPFLGGDATNNPDLVTTAGTAAAEGFAFISDPLPKDLTNDNVKAFLASFSAKYGKATSSIYAVYAGDGFNVVTAAIAGAKSADPDKVADFLRTQLKDYPGLTGAITFDAKGDRVGGGYRVYRVDGAGTFILQP